MHRLRDNSKNDLMESEFDSVLKILLKKISEAKNEPYIDRQLQSLTDSGVQS